MLPRRLTLWALFVGVHAVVVVLGWILPSQPMGDVYNVYEPWSTQALAGGSVVGITEPWVYPQLALLPMLAAHALAWTGSYTLGWAVLVTLADAIGFAVLIGRGRSRARIFAGLAWLAYILALGPVGLYRLDAVTVPLAVVALLIALRRPAVAAALMAMGAWIKIWPAAGVAALWIALRGRRWPVVAAAIGTSAVVVAVVVALGGGANVLGFAAAQVGRGLQIESVAATPFMWLAALGAGIWWAGFDAEIITFQVYGPGVDAVAAAATPLMVLGAVAVCAVGFVKAQRGASPSRLLPPLLLCLVLVLIVGNKVGSPQFQTWLIAPMVLWICLDFTAARRPLALALVVAVLTQLIYPVFYDLVRVAQPAGVVLLTMRNAGLIALLVWTLVRLARVRTSGRVSGPRVR